jgi:hypothetical protein
MVSLFPRNTFKNRKNGLRADLAQVIADMNPKFVRFPGGCAAHGDGLDNMYLWKRSIGKLEERQHMPNIWNYHQTLGLGYYEYFQFCEDIGAEPLPVLPAGVPCQNSSRGGHGQQGGGAPDLSPIAGDRHQQGCHPHRGAECQPAAEKDDSLFTLVHSITQGMYMNRG